MTDIKSSKKSWLINLIFIILILTPLLIHLTFTLLNANRLYSLNDNLFGSTFQIIWLILISVPTILIILILKRGITKSFWILILAVSISGFSAWASFNNTPYQCNGNYEIQISPEINREPIYNVYEKNYNYFLNKKIASWTRILDNRNARKSTLIEVENEDTFKIIKPCIRSHILDRSRDYNVKADINIVEKIREEPSYKNSNMLSIEYQYGF
ncbi:MAG: hypothetical protein WCK98_01845 [bacterium]